MKRVYNFSPGPSMLALPVLEQVQKDLVSYGDTGMSVMEMSHRSKMYQAIFDEAVALLRKLMDVPDGYKVLFLQGGATQQFSAVPLNLMQHGRADYVDSGNFAHLASVEAQRYGEVRIAGSIMRRTFSICSRLSFSSTGSRPRWRSRTSAALSRGTAPTTGRPSRSIASVTIARWLSEP